MYYLLYDQRTSGIYMTPTDPSFWAYSDESKCISKPAGTYLVMTEYETEKEIKTVMWLAGFVRGFIDDDLVLINRAEILAFGRNANDICYCQFKLTRDVRYLDEIADKDLYTVVNIIGDNAFFPTVEKDDLIYILAYTAKERISKELIEMYPDYQIAKTSFEMPFVINEEVFIS